MTILKSILVIIIITFIALAGLSHYGSSHTQYLFNYQIIGMPELCLSMLFGWICTLILLVTITIEHKIDSKFYFGISDKLNELQHEKEKLSEAFELERRAYNILNDEFESFKPTFTSMREHNQKLTISMNNLEVENKTLKFATEEQANAIHSKDAKIEELILKIKKPKTKKKVVKK